jgi:predicted SAM-dependent methyltransferase
VSGAVNDARQSLKRVPGLVPVVRRGRDARTAATRAAEDARWLVAGRVRRDVRIDAYLRKHDVRKLQLGTGSNPMDGWLNTDVVDYRRRNEVVYLDARQPFPLPDRSFDLVFSEHMIEHLTYADGRRCLAECLRVLRPNGRIRVATPSLDRLIPLYADELTDLQRRYLKWSIDTFVGDVDAYLPGFVLNNMFRNFAHRFVYDEATLRHALETSGFVDAEAWPVGESGDPRLVGLERHMRSVAEFNALETMVLEARRP